MSLPRVPANYEDILLAIETQLVDGAGFLQDNIGMGLAEDIGDCGSQCDRIGFPADRQKPIDRDSGRLRTGLRCGLVDSRTTVEIRTA